MMNLDRSKGPDVGGICVELDTGSPPHALEHLQPLLPEFSVRLLRTPQTLANEMPPRSNCATTRGCGCAKHYAHPPSHTHYTCTHDTPARTQAHAYAHTHSHTGTSAHANTRTHSRHDTWQDIRYLLHRSSSVVLRSRWRAPCRRRRRRGPRGCVWGGGGA
jgi:hypothetical protein